MFSAELTGWDRGRVSIGLIWLFHLSGIIGISIGYADWFIPKTPVNLLLAFSLLIANYPINGPRKIGLTIAFFAVGMLAEWTGVQTGLLFGSYSYGANLGPKIDGVPLLIGVNWALLVIITGTMANVMTKHFFSRILIGAGLMVFLDFFLEHSAPLFDFWTFAGGIAPFQNYLAWFVIAAGLHGLFQWFRMDGDLAISFHLYAAQFLFFFFFFFWV